MNNPAKSAIAIAVVLMALIAVTTTMADGAEPDIVINTPGSGEDTNTELTSYFTYSNNRPDLELTLNLSGGSEYTINKDSNASFYGKSLTIDGDPEKTGTKSNVAVTGNQQINTNTETGASLVVRNINFTVDSASTGDTRLSFYYYKNVQFENCSINGVLIMLSSKETPESSITVRNCQFNVEDSKAYSGQYALTLKGHELRAEDVSIENYDRGLNLEMSTDGIAQAYASGCKFSNIDGKCALQFSYGTEDMDVEITKCTFTTCETAISIHNTTNGEGKMVSAGNTFNGCTTDFLYSTSSDTSEQTISSMGILSAGDTFDDGTPSVKSEDGTTEIPAEDPVITTWYDPDANSLLIDSMDDLYEFALVVNSGIDFSGKTVTLVNDIDLAGSDWTPIGTDSNPFRGVFDGGGNKISNLSITKTGTDNIDLHLGLFGVVEGVPNDSFTQVSSIINDTTGIQLDQTNISEGKYTAVIKNLNLENVNIKASGSMVGSLAGLVNDALISNVHVTSGEIVGTNSVGGIIGRGYGTVITECSTSTELTVGSGDNKTGNVYNFGGIAGSLRSTDGGSSLCAVIDTDNYASLSVYLSAGGVGGIVGQTNSGFPFIIFGCENHGNVTITSNVTVTNVYSAVAGGIAGQTPGTTDNIIANSKNYGNVTSSSTTPSGSVSGIANYYSGLIYGCENHGDISGNAYYAAGMVSYGSTVIVDGCSNTGSVSVSISGASSNDGSTDKGYWSSICAGTFSTTYRNMTFADVYELADALVKASKGANTLRDSGAALVLEDITVTNTNGTLDLPQFLNTLTSETPICTEIVIGDRNVHQTYGEDNKSSVNNVILTIGAPNADIVIEEGTEISSDTAKASLTLTADGMTLRNDGTVDTVRIDGADNVTIYNEGTIKIVRNQIEDKYTAGRNMVLYNGSSTGSQAKINHITTSGDNSEIYNYGTISREDTGHTLNFGRAWNDPDNTEKPDNRFTATVHNYGTIIGGTNGANYIIYAPGVKTLNVYNYEGSTMQQGTGGNWFIFYGLDGLSTTTGTVSDEDKGTLNFIYHDGTVKDAAGTTHSVTANDFVRVGDADRTLNITPQTTDSVNVIYHYDADGLTQSFIVNNGVVTGSPSWTRTGFELSGWTKDDQPWDPETATDINTDLDVYAVWSLVTPQISLNASAGTGDEIALKAVISNKSGEEGVTYAYQWSKDGVVISGSNSETLTTDGPGRYEVSVTVTYEGTSKTGTTEYTIVNPDAPTFTITFRYPSILGWTNPAVQILTPGEPIDVSDFNIQEGFVLKSLKYKGMEITTSYVPISDMTIDIEIGIKIEQFSVEQTDYDDHSIVSLNYSTEATGVNAVFILTNASEPPKTFSGNEIRVDVEGEYVVAAYLFVGEDFTSSDVSGIAMQNIQVKFTESSTNPSYDDEDLPPIIKPGTSGSSKDDTVTIVACAAAAVVAALMAVFLIVLYRKD